MHTFADKKLMMLRPGDINHSLNQSRKSFDEYELKMLADSIARNGIIQPLIIRRTFDGKYELITGERRLRAAMLAGLRRIPCIVHRADDETADFYSIIENFQRSDLDFFDEIEGLNRLCIKYSLSPSEVAHRLGISPSALSSRLCLLKLSPEIREKISNAKLSERHALALLSAPEDRHMEILSRVINETLSPDKMQELILDLLNPRVDTKPSEEPAKQPPEEPPIKKIMIGDVRLFSNSLYKLIDTLQTAGIETKTRKSETSKYIEYKVRIEKATHDTGKYKQLKIC